MNKVFFHTCILFLVAIIASSVGAFLVSSHFLLNFVNISFYIALVFILIGGFLFIFQNGFFNVTIYAFQRVFGTNKKIDSLIEEAEELSIRKNVFIKHIHSNGRIRFVLPVSYLGCSRSSLALLF